MIENKFLREFLVVECLCESNPKRQQPRECLRCMNINHISCHHFWIDPELTLRSHKLWFFTPSESLCWKFQSAHIAHTKLSDARRRRQRDFNFISLASACSRCAVYQQTENLSAVLLWLCLLRFCRSFFFRGSNHQQQHSHLHCTIGFWLVAFNLCVKDGNLYDNGAQNRRWKLVGFDWGNLPNENI